MGGYSKTIFKELFLNVWVSGREASTETSWFCRPGRACEIEGRRESCVWMKVVRSTTAKRSDSADLRED
eukprot:6185465-Pleurochrysis_carterae.AAC.1